MYASVTFTVFREKMGIGRTDLDFMFRGVKFGRKLFWLISIRSKNTMTPKKTMLYLDFLDKIDFFNTIEEKKVKFLIFKIFG